MGKMSRYRLRTLQRIPHRQELPDGTRAESNKPRLPVWPAAGTRRTHRSTGAVRCRRETRHYSGSPDAALCRPPGIDLEDYRAVAKALHDSLAEPSAGLSAHHGKAAR